MTRNRLEKFIFHCMQNGADARVTRRCFNNAAFRAYTNVTVMSQNNACYSDTKFSVLRLVSAQI